MSILQFLDNIACAKSKRFAIVEKKQVVVFILSRLGINTQNDCTRCIATFMNRYCILFGIDNYLV